VSVVINGATAKGGLMEKPYTHTTWRVRAGSDDEFVRRWSEWVDWSHREGLEAPALLLRDLRLPPLSPNNGSIWTARLAMASDLL
jgi:hypothetical protein